MHVVETGLHQSLLLVTSCNRHGWNVGKPTYMRTYVCTCMHGETMVTVSRNADILIVTPVTMFCVFLCCHSHNTPCVRTSPVHACLSDSPYRLLDATCTYACTYTRALAYFAFSINLLVSIHNCFIHQSSLSHHGTHSMYVVLLLVHVVSYLCVSLDLVLAF